MRFILFDRWGTPKGDIANPVEAVVKRGISDEWSDTLDMTCDTDVAKGDRLLVNDGDWREYICVSPEDIREDTLVSTPHFENSVQELQTARYIEEYHETVVTPRRALEYVLQGTRWQVDQIATDMNAIELKLERICGYDALKQIADTLGLEIATRIKILGTGTGVEQRYVSLVHRVGDDTRQRFEYGANLTSVRRTFSDQDVITRLYVYGKSVSSGEGEDEKPITITGVAGKPYLDADPKILEEWGVPDGKGGKLPAYGVIEHTDIDSVSRLYDQAVADLAELSKPRVTYEADVASLEAGGVDTSKLDIGDLIQVVDTCFTPALRLQARIVAYDEDLLNPANSTITLGSIIETVSRRQTQAARTTQIVTLGKPVWDAASTTATAAHDTATSVSGEVTGLSTRVEDAVKSAASAQTMVRAVGGMTDITVTVAEFADKLSATKAVSGLAASMMAGPPPDRAQMSLWAACQPIILDHDTDETIPAGAIRVDVKTKPTADLIIRLAALKGATTV